MKDFKHFGVRFKGISSCNYTAIWSNLITIRLGDKEIKELPADKAEFYDVSLGNKCVTGKCPWCYVDSNPNRNFGFVRIDGESSGLVVMFLAQASNICMVLFLELIQK